MGLNFSWQLISAAPSHKFWVLHVATIPTTPYYLQYSPLFSVRIPAWLLWTSVFANPFVKMSNVIIISCLKKQATKADARFAVLWWTWYYGGYHSQNSPQGKQNEAIPYIGHHGFNTGSHSHPGYKWLYTRNQHLTNQSRVDQTVVYEIAVIRSLSKDVPNTTVPGNSNRTFLLVGESERSSMWREN